MKKLYIALLAGFILSVSSCKDDPEFTITPALGFLDTEGSVAQNNGIDVHFYSNVPLTEAVAVQVQINNASDLVYGTDYTTVPAAESGIINVATDPETGKGKFRVVAIQTGVVTAKKVSFQIISVSGGDIQPAQSAALNYTLQVQGFRNVEKVNLTFDFNTDLTGFTERIVGTAGITANSWASSAFGYPSETTKCAEANAFGKAGTGESNTYLVITNALPASDYNVKALVYSRFAGAGQIKFRFSTTYSGTGDPEAAGVTWTDIATMNSALPAAASQTWKEVSGKIESPSDKKVYFAIQYSGAKAASASNWRIDDLKISN